MAALTLLTKKNLRDYDAKLKENLGKIEKAIGLSGLTLEVKDMGKCAAAAKDCGYENRVGEVIYDWYMSGIAENIVRLAKDDMVKEALHDAISAKKITFRVDDAAESYHDEKFEDGCLAILVKANSMGTNVGSTGEGLDKLL